MSFHHIKTTSQNKPRAVSEIRDTHLSIHHLYTLINVHTCVCVRIQERHAVFRNEQRRVTLTPQPGSKVIVNGHAVSQATELQHLVGLHTTAHFMIRLCNALLKDTHNISLSLFSSPSRTVSFSAPTVPTCSSVTRRSGAGMTGAATTTTTSSLSWLLLRASTSVSGRINSWR